MEHTARFLPNRPIGEDLYDGQSQDRIASAIKEHILDVDAIEDNNCTLPRIIGIEGTWGSGKSNTLLQLDKKLGDNYYFFTYDAWGNQEDLQRRSLLQQLTTKLIDDEMLVGDTSVNQVSSALDFTPKAIKCSWKTRVEVLVSRKSATHNITVPTIYDSTKAFVFMLLITGLIIPLINSVKWSNVSWWYLPIALVIAVLPALGFWRLMKYKHKKWMEEKDPQKKASLIGWTWKEMWQMYQTSGRTDTSTFTISDIEPSVTEFRKWMTDLSNALVDKRRLVIVFDNMDRLPSEKVRQLWSSIQTFFADKGYTKVWCVVPFDREHLANAFSDANEEDKRLELTNYFIEKTFPVVYRIPDPIITDYKMVFEKLFAKAFDERDDQELINRCYRLKYTKPNIREIISFINKLVAQTHEWGNNIQLTSMALFLLNQEDILKDPEQNIINRSYLRNFPGMFEESEDLDTEISALAYGVDKKDAGQLPMKNLINLALNKTDKTPFKEYAQQTSHFYVILREEIYGMDEALLNNAINQVSVLSFENLSVDDGRYLHKVWSRLAKLYLKTKDKETSFRKEVKALLDNCEPITKKQEIGNHFLSSFANQDNIHKGAEWFKVYKDVATYSIEKELALVLPEHSMKNEDYVEYVRAAKEEYRNYPISCSNEDVNQYCEGQIANNLDVMDILRLQEGDERVEFSKLHKYARMMMEEHHDVSNSNFEPVVKVLKYLSKEPLKLKLDANTLNTIMYDGVMKADYQVLMMLTDLEVNEPDIKGMAQVVFCYDTMETIWDKCKNVNTNVVVKLAGYLIANGLHDGKPTTTKDVVSEMVKVKTQAALDEKTIIKYLNNWGRKELTPEENALDFANILNNEAWIDALEADKNVFAKALLSKFYKDCGGMQTSSFINASNSWIPGNYWPKMLKRLAHDPEFWYTNPKNMKDLVEKLLVGICGETINANSMDVAMLDSIFANVKFDEISTKVNDVLTKFGSSYKMNEYKFLRLHHYFEQTINHEEQILNNVLKPVIGVVPVQNVVLGKQEYYEPLLKKYLGQASDLKAELIKLYDSSQNLDLKALIDRIGIIQLEEEKKDVPTEEST